MFCSNCGTEIPEGSRFCPSCGSAVGAAKEFSASKVSERVVKGVGRAVDSFDVATGGSGHVDLRFSDLFSETFKKHAKGDAEEVFICGTRSTTPDVHNVSSEWPHPWVWSRVLIVMVAVVFCCLVLAQLKETSYVFPSIMFLGSAAIPLSLLVFFFETNVWRNVSIVETMLLFLVGGLLATLSLFFDSLFGLGDFMGTGDFVESLVSAIVNLTSITAIIALAMQQRGGKVTLLGNGRNYILNGMLVGAAIGAGFALLDNSAVAFQWWYDFGFEGLRHAMLALSIASIGRFVMWGAAIGGALALCEGEDGFDAGQLADPRFLVVAALCLVLHTLWYTILPVFNDALIFFGEAYVKYAILSIVIWVVVTILINRGLSQVNELTREES